MKLHKRWPFPAPEPISTKLQQRTFRRTRQLTTVSESASPDERMPNSAALLRKLGWWGAMGNNEPPLCVQITRVVFTVPGPERFAREEQNR